MNTEVCNLLVLIDSKEQIASIRKSYESQELSVQIESADIIEEFKVKLSHRHYDAAVACYPSDEYKINAAIHCVNAHDVAIPLLILNFSNEGDVVRKWLSIGVADCVMSCDILRLPHAVQNATERFALRAEQELYFNELTARKSLMKDAERLAHFGSWREDIISKKLHWSDEKFRILGFAPGSIRPSWEKFYSKIHPEDIDFVRSTIEETIASRNRQKFTFRIVSEKGQIKYIHSEIFVNRDEHLNLLQLNGFIRDISEHTEAEIKLVESEEKYRNLFENNPSALFVVDAATSRFIDVNKTAIQQYGYSRNEFLSMYTYSLIPVEERELVKQSGLSFPDLPNENGVWENLRKDGQVIQVEITLSEIVFEGNKSRLILANDVTDKLLTINRLKESEARLITSQRIAHIGSWEIFYKNNEPDYSTTKWTDETYLIYGYDKQETRLTPDFLKRIIHADDQYIIEDARDNTTIENPEYSIEYRIILHNGTERVVSELGEVTYNLPSGKRLKISGTIQDITENKRAAELLQKSEANLRSIFENTDTIYVLLDLNLDIVSFNNQATKFAEKHFRREIAENTNAVEYFSPHVRQPIKRTLEKALNGHNLNYEVNYPDAFGITKWYYAHFHPVWSKEKAVLGVIMSFRDITGRKTSELQEKKITEELIKRNKDLEQFAYIISHNLRAPVANILGISAVLNNNDDIDEQERAIFMDGLHDSIKKLDMVIIDLNRILQMKNEVNEIKEEVKFSQLVNDIKFSISGLDSNELYQILCDFTEVDEMKTLRSYIYSIFYNLISNSLKYKQPGLMPQIHVKSKMLENKLFLHFKDNGLGIDLERNKDQMFGLYKRFHQQTAEGKGMGLFMVKTQVETLGGKIGVSSKVNEGTEFIIEFEIPKD